VKWITVDSKVEGLAELEQFLRTLPDQMQRSMLTSALKAAAAPILKQAQTNVSLLFNHPGANGKPNRYSGVLAAGMRTAKVKGYYAVTVNVQLKTKGVDSTPQTIHGVRKPYGWDPFYGRFLEKGTSKMAAKPWLQPAALAQQTAAGTAMNASLQKRIAAWCKKNGVRYEPGGPL
jgi:HK97 gp10 family phage protein